MADEKESTEKYDRAPSEDSGLFDTPKDWAERFGTVVDFALALFPYVMLAAFMVYSVYVLPKNVATAVVRTNVSDPSPLIPKPPESTATQSQPKSKDTLRSTVNTSDANAASQSKTPLESIEEKLNQIDRHLTNFEFQSALFAAHDDPRITNLLQQFEHLNTQSENILRLIGATDPKSKEQTLLFQCDRRPVTVAVAIARVMREVTEVNTRLDPKIDGSVIDQFQKVVANKFDRPLTNINESLRNVLELKQALLEQHQRVEVAEEQVALVLYNTANLQVDQYRQAIDKLKNESSYLPLLNRYRLGIFTASNARVQNTIRDFETAKENWSQISNPIGSENLVDFCKSPESGVPFPSADHPWRRYVFVVSTLCQPPSNTAVWQGVKAVDVVMVQNTLALDTSMIEGWDQFCRLRKGEFVLLRKLEKGPTAPPKAAAERDPAVAKSDSAGPVTLNTEMMETLMLRLERLIVPRLHLGK